MMRRTSISIPSDLLHRFDEVSGNVGERNRSNAVAMAMREYIVSRKWLEKKGAVSGALLITYDHDAHGINDAMTDAQHEAGKIINASMHVHLDARRCLEITAFRGDAEDVKKLAKDLSGIKGILDLKVVVSSD